MLCDRPNALNLLGDLGRRIGLRLNRVLGHCDPVEELSLRLFPNNPRKARFWPVTLDRSLVLRGVSHNVQNRVYQSLWEWLGMSGSPLRRKRFSLLQDRLDSQVLKICWIFVAPQNSFHKHPHPRPCTFPA